MTDEQIRLYLFLKKKIKELDEKKVSKNDDKRQRSEKEFRHGSS